MQTHTHLCLVSQQATPNLLPVLDPTTQPKNVILLVSKDMGKQANWLEKVFKQRGIKTTQHNISDVYDFNLCWEEIYECLQQDESIALNVTGGTKVMAMAAQDVFREAKKPVFYVNIENDTLIRIDDRRASPIPLASRIKLSEFLETHGYHIERKDNPQINGERRDALNRLAYESERLGKALGRLNYLAQQAQKSMQVTLTSEDMDSRSLGDLLSQFEQLGWLKQQANKLLFTNETTRKLVNGGWLEELIYQTLSDLSPKLGGMDFALNVEVTAPDGKTRNELDAACMYRNTLHIIECKSANMDESKANNALYKLDALKKLGGLRTRTLLIDYRGGLNQADEQRARDGSIKILSGSQLRRLPQELEHWLKNAK